MIRKKGIVQSGRVSFTREIFVLWYAVKDNRTPVYAKLLALAAIIYLVSPIDFIPDFIPVAGYLDDLVIVPVLLHVAFSMLPGEVKAAALSEVKKHIIFLRIVLVICIVILMTIMAVIFFTVKQLFHF